MNKTNQITVEDVIKAQKKMLNSVHKITDTSIFLEKQNELIHRYKKELNRYFSLIKEKNNINNELQDTHLLISKKNSEIIIEAQNNTESEFNKCKNETTRKAYIDNKLSNESQKLIELNKKMRSLDVEIEISSKNISLIKTEISMTLTLFNMSKDIIVDYI